MATDGAIREDRAVGSNRRDLAEERQPRLAAPPLLAAIVAPLAPGGWLAVPDLEREDGSFHDEPVPLLGFVPEMFATLMSGVGLVEIRSEQIFVMERPDRPRSYPVFLAACRKD